MGFNPLKITLKSFFNLYLGCPLLSKIFHKYESDKKLKIFLKRKISVFYMTKFKPIEIERIREQIEFFYKAFYIRKMKIPKRKKKKFNFFESRKKKEYKSKSVRIKNLTLKTESEKMRMFNFSKDIKKRLIINFEDKKSFCHSIYLNSLLHSKIKKKLKRYHIVKKTNKRKKLLTDFYPRKISEKENKVHKPRLGKFYTFNLKKKPNFFLTKKTQEFKNNQNGDNIFKQPQKKRILREKKKNFLLKNDTADLYKMNDKKSFNRPSNQDKIFFNDRLINSEKKEYQKIVGKNKYLKIDQSIEENISNDEKKKTDKYLKTNKKDIAKKILIKHNYTFKKKRIVKINIIIKMVMQYYQYFQTFSKDLTRVYLTNIITKYLKEDKSREEAVELFNNIKKSNKNYFSFKDFIIYFEPNWNESDIDKCLKKIDQILLY